MENLLDGKLFLSDCERLRKANGVGRPLALAWKAKTIGQQLLLFRENLMGKFFSEKKENSKIRTIYFARKLYYQMKYLLTGSAVQATIYCPLWSKIVSLVSCINKSRFEVYLYFDHFLITSLRFCCNIFSQLNLINLCFFIFLLAGKKKIICRVGAVVLSFDMS